MSYTTTATEQTTDNLYRQHHQWLQRWLLRKVPCSADADDLTQDVFIRTINSTDVGTISEPRAFLTVLAKRVLANFWRRHELEQAYLDALSEMPESWAPSAEELASIKQAIFQIDAFLSELPVKVKHAFLLSKLEGLTHLEIAGEMGISVATVERYIKQAFMHCYMAHDLNAVYP